MQVTWGGSTMIEAERLLLMSALADHANQRFVMLSDKLPLTTHTSHSEIAIFVIFSCLCIHLTIEQYIT
jgi:Core-2/I-Branching enzyme